MNSAISRSHQALHTSAPGSGFSGDKDSIQSKVDVDWSTWAIAFLAFLLTSDGLDLILSSGYPPHVLSYEPNALVRYCFFRQLGSVVLAAYDACQ